MSFDLVVRGGRLVSPEGILRADIAVLDGKIAAIGHNLEAEQTRDADGLIILPGGVDPHVHLDMPAGQTTSADDWQTGTQAAVCGGTTSVIDFIETEPGQSLWDAYQERRQAAEAGSLVDFGLHMTLDARHLSDLDEIADLVEAGLPSFKLYTTYEGFKLTDQELLLVMDAVQSAGGMVLVHCESDAVVSFATQRQVESGKLTPSSHPLSRPPAAEMEAVQRVLILAGLVGVPVYIVHISTKEGALALERALRSGQIAWGETCPQYLLLNEQLYSSPGFEGAKYVCSPPLRQSSNCEALWHALKAKNLHTIATDHCPFDYHGQKDLGRDDFRKIPGGLPGIQTRLELIYSYGVGFGRLDLQEWVNLCCTQPARIFGLYPRKGVLKVGSDADLVLFDPQQSKIIHQTDLLENVDYSPYEGFELKGAVVEVLVAGQSCARDGVLLTERQGNFLPRQRKEPR